ncbi:MAG TPA: type II secretion system F family protein [Deltaproteobacteria bacterium]|nr:type II secretion system F family protein [Deltaproteobacteria bacterium]
MLFSYQAVSPEGAVVNGKAQFRDIQELMDALSSEELILLRYKQRRFFILDEIEKIFLPKIERLDIVEFCESLSSMVGSGLPLLESVETIKDTIKNKRLRMALTNVIRDISGGNSLSQAFAGEPTVFPQMLVFFCNIGEETGTIQEALKNTAEHLKKLDDIISQTKRALIYPAFVISAMSAVMVFWLFFVLPRLVETFNDMDVVLPEITRKLVTFVEICKHDWYLFPLIIAAFAAAIYMLRKNEHTHLFLARMYFRIPVVGDLLKYSNLTLFFSNMSLMLRSGVTLTKCFDVLEITFRNPAIKSIVARLRRSTASGDSLFAAFSQAGFFDAITLRMVSVGESTGTLDQRLTFLADTYEERTSKFVDVMGKMIEPIVMALSGGLFVFIVVSLIGPVYDLISQLGGG